MVPTYKTNVVLNERVIKMTKDIHKIQNNPLLLSELSYFKDHKVLPAPDLMYDEETLNWLKSQMGYVCDQIEMAKFNPHAMDFFRDQGHLFRL